MLCTLPGLQAPPSWSSSARCGNNRHRPQPEDDLEPSTAVPASRPEIVQVRHASFVFSLQRFSRNYKKQGAGSDGGLLFLLRWLCARQSCHPFGGGFHSRPSCQRQKERQITLKFLRDEEILLHVVVPVFA